MQINDNYLDSLIDAVLGEIEHITEHTIGDRDVTDSEYAELFNEYRKKLINELK